MRKILILSLLFITTIFISVNVKALEGYTYDHDYTDRWEIYNVYSTYYALRLNQIELIDHSTEILIRIPENSDSIQTYGGQESRIVLYDDTVTELDTIHLDDLIGEDISGAITFQLLYNTLYSEQYYELQTSYSYTDIAYIDVLVMLSVSSSPSASYLEAWKDDTGNSFIITTEQIPVIFYAYSGGSYNQVYDTQFIYQELPTKPTDPTVLPTTDSEFLGWKSITGDYYNFEDPITADMINSDNVLVFYATYKGINEPVDVTTSISSNIPDGLDNLMSVINANTIEGYFLLFIFINILIIILALILKLNSFIALISSIGVFGLFIYFGVINTFIIIILAFIYILLLSGNFISNKGGQV